MLPAELKAFETLRSQVTPEKGLRARLISSEIVSTVQHRWRNSMSLLLGGAFAHRQSPPSPLPLSLKEGEGERRFGVGKQREILEEAGQDRLFIWSARRRSCRRCGRFRSR